MGSIEDMVADKIIEMINYLLSKFIKPDITIKCVTQLNSEKIENLKTKYGIEGVILDVDDTLRKNMGNIPQCNREWIENLRGKLKIVIFFFQTYCASIIFIPFFVKNSKKNITEVFLQVLSKGAWFNKLT